MTRLKKIVPLFPRGVQALRQIDTFLNGVKKNQRPTRLSAEAAANGKPDHADVPAVAAAQDASNSSIIGG